MNKIQPDKTLIWFHIPKTAGTSLSAEIGSFDLPWAHVAAGVRCGDVVVESELAYLIARRDETLRGDFRVMFGHFTQREFNEVFQDSPPFCFATMLRDPVDRCCSEYRYLVSSTSNPDRQAHQALFPTIEHFLEEQCYWNVQARYLQEREEEDAKSIVERLSKAFLLEHFHLNRTHSRSLRCNSGILPGRSSR